jgi:hypothetical protein
MSVDVAREEQASVHTALQKIVRYAFPILENAVNMAPKSPRVEIMAKFSTRVMACSASARSAGELNSVIMPLLAGAEPEANGSKKPAGMALARIIQ